MSSHLNEINETYFQHMQFACKVATRMILAGFALIIHAIFPSLFVTTASGALKELTEEIQLRKDKMQEFKK